MRFLCLLVLMFSGVAHAQLEVATSFSILEDVVKNVGGARVNISNLVPRNSDAHGYQPSAKEVKALAKAKLIFVAGLGFESWFAKLAKNANPTARVVDLSVGIKTRKLEQNPDPHVWWNPLNVVLYVQRIRDALVRADPTGKASYVANASRYTQALTDVDAWAKLEVQTIKNRNIITNHDALGYLADRYGFRIVGTIIPGGSTERAPSAKETADLIRLIRRQKVNAIFTENVVNAKLAQSIATETGAKIAPPLYTDALGAPGSSGETYLKAFGYNISTLVAALR